MKKEGENGVYTFACAHRIQPFRRRFAALKKLLSIKRRKWVRKSCHYRSRRDVRRDRLFIKQRKSAASSRSSAARSTLQSAAGSIKFTASITKTGILCCCAKTKRATATLSPLSLKRGQRAFTASPVPIWSCCVNTARGSSRFPPALRVRSRVRFPSATMTKQKPPPCATVRFSARTIFTSNYKTTACANRHISTRK